MHDFLNPKTKTLASIIPQKRRKVSIYADVSREIYRSANPTYRWARGNAIVNEYELDETGLIIHTFTRNSNWFHYIFDNRRARDGLTADVVMGPIANDTILDTLGIMSSGYLKPEDALKLLLIGPEYIQVAIKTEKAVKKLHFLRSEKIERITEDKLKTEQDKYQEAFAREFEKIMK